MDTFKDTTQNHILALGRSVKGRFFQAEGEEKICLWPILTILLTASEKIAGCENATREAKTTSNSNNFRRTKNTVNLAY